MPTSKKDLGRDNEGLKPYQEEQTFGTNFEKPRGMFSYLVRVGPQQVAEQPLVGHVCGPHDPPDLLHGLQVRAEAAVAAEDLLVDDGGHWEAVEAVGERLPQLDVVAAFAWKKLVTCQWCKMQL